MLKDRSTYIIDTEFFENQNRKAISINFLNSALKLYYYFIFIKFNFFLFCSFYLVSDENKN